MINIGMCDDNLESIRLASKFLESELMEQDVDAEISLVTTSQKEIFDAIYKKDIDVLILDIDFKSYGKNGLEFAKDLRSINKDFYLVFLSAHQRYMHVSFYVKVFDYLVKPINKETISSLVERIKEEFTYDTNIFLHLNKWISVRTDNILFIEKVGNKCSVITRDNTYYTTKTLDTLLNELPRNFRKCHRSYIINENKIISVNKKDNYAYFSRDLFCPINSYFRL